MVSHSIFFIVIACCCLVFDIIMDFFIDFISWSCIEGTSFRAFCHYITFCSFVSFLFITSRLNILAFFIY
jgi:hypothetical protein